MVINKIRTATDSFGSIPRLGIVGMIFMKLEFELFWNFWDTLLTIKHLKLNIDSKGRFFADDDTLRGCTTVGGDVTDLKLASK